MDGQDELSAMLTQARTALQCAFQSSKQGSFERRAPDPAALHYIQEAEQLLLKVLQRRPQNAEALTMLSQVAELVLDYPRAIRYLQQAVQSRGYSDKKALKRLQLLREHLVFWRDLPLNADQLSELGAFLRSMGVGPEDHSFRFTREWIAVKGIDNSDAVISAFERHGAFSDFQVLVNLATG